MKYRKVDMSDPHVEILQSREPMKGEYSILIQLYSTKVSSNIIPYYLKENLLKSIDRQTTLLGEYGNPRTSHLDTLGQISRLSGVDVDQVALQYRDLWVDEDYGKHHPELEDDSLIAVVGWVKPTGPFKEQALKLLLANPRKYIFSIRHHVISSLDEDYTIYSIKDIIAIDVLPT